MSFANEQMTKPRLVKDEILIIFIGNTQGKIWWAKNGDDRVIGI